MIPTGAMTGVRYTVTAEAVPEDFRDRYMAALEDNAFREPLTAVHKEQRVGWVQVHNLLDTSFADINRWLYNHYLVFSLRMDKKVLPAKLFGAHLQKRVDAWCEANKRERCPSKVKAELKEALEIEMLQKTLPDVTLYPVVWNVAEGWVFFYNQSETPNDMFRKLFHRTFGIALIPFDPIEFLTDEGLVMDMLVRPPPVLEASNGQE